MSTDKYIVRYLLQHIHHFTSNIKGLLSVLRWWFSVVDSLLIVTPIVGFCNCSILCCALLCVLSSFVNISMGKRELIALLCLSSWCLVIVVWLFLTMPWVCLQFVIVVFPDHTQLLFLMLSGLPANKCFLQENMTRKCHSHRLPTDQ